MIPASTFAYPQARLQARFGRQPSESLWRRLAGIAEFAPYLDAVRGSPLHPWVADLTAASDVHDIESGLRDRLRATIGEVARWMPESWRPAVRWVGTLLDLPALHLLLRGGVAPPWMRRDTQLGTLLDDESRLRHERLRSGAYAALALAWDHDQPLTQGWLAQWRSLWPRGAAHTDALEDLVGLVERHRLRFPGLHTRDSDAERAALHERARHTFRRHLFQSAAAFSYLLLIGLDAERLRGELVTRCLFETVAAP